MAEATWYKLDNVGKFYAAQAGSSKQTVFRISAEMADDVDEACLQAALDRAVQICPSFNVTLRSGFFWHYLEQSKVQAKAQKEDLPICFRLHDDHSSVLFRVSFYGRRINLEVSHMVSDGRGTLEFFKVLIASYAKERYGTSGAAANSNGTAAEMSEDSFSQNYEKHRAGSTSMPSASHISGWRNDVSPTYMEYHLKASEVRAKAKEMGASVTSLLIAAVISAIGKNLHSRQFKRNICINIPVDLRRFFGSGTLRNFFGLSYVAYPAEKSTDALGRIAASVQEQLSHAIKPDVIKRRMNRMVKLEKSPFLRFAPLFLKDAALDIADKISARDITATVSNLGIVEIPEHAAPYVRSVNVLTSTTSINFTACSFGDDLSIGISSVYISNAIPREICRTFSAMGLSGYININKNAHDVAVALKQARLERALAHSSQAEDVPL